jgi:DNA-binding MarR family transcriptional regulator
MNQDSITYVFSMFATKHRDALEKIMTEINLHAGQIFVLNSLWDTDGQSQADLAKSLKLSAPTIYNMVVRMAEKDFVTVKKDPHDGRIMRIFLTEKGRNIKPKVEEKWQELEDFTFRNLTEPEKMMFTMLLQKVVFGE